MRKQTDKQPEPETTGHFSAARGLVLAAVLAGTIAAFYFLLLAHLGPPRGSRLALWPVVAIGAWAAYIQPVAIRNRRFSLEVSLSEIPALLGIAFLAPWAVLTAGFAGILAAHVQLRRHPVKALINSLASLAAAELGTLCYDGLMHRASPVSSRGWLLGAAAVATIVISDLVLVLGAFAISDRRWRRMPTMGMLIQVGLDIAVCTAGAFVAISLVWVSTWGVLLVIALAVAVDLAYRATVVSGQRYANLEKLYEFTRRLSSLSEARDVIAAVLEQASTLLSASRAQLVVPLDAPLEGLALRCSLKADGTPLFHEGVPFSPLDKLVRERGALLLPRDPKDKAVANAMDAEGISEGLAAPLSRGEPLAGHLLVADRAFKHEGFNTTDLHFFEALATNAGVALRSSELLEKFRHEAAVRRHEAHHDALTGLPNRTLFSQHLEQALDVAAEEDGGVAVMLLDLDGFKEINDTLGHSTGDAILREIARRMATFEEDGAMVARLGGDEFAVVVSGPPDNGAIKALAERIVASICEPLAADGLLLDVQASLGIACYPEHAGHATGLLRCADVAMYAAKAAGVGVRAYDIATDRSTPRRLQLATELRRAMDAKALDLWYQPVVQLDTGDVISCEALLRWSHDQFGPIPPTEFIPVAESAGLIDQLTWWVLEVALKQAKAWREFVPRLSMAVNLSARSLLSTDIADKVADVIRRVGLDPSVLTLELTESSTIADPIGSERVLQSLRELGVNLSIDDFGTGYSSLSRLRSLPFQELKIDKSFIKEMTHDRGDEAIVRSTIDLARNLGRIVTAEGVEDQATLRRLAALGCDAAQGFFLARPQPAPQCEEWLLEMGTSRTALILPPRRSRR